MAMAEWTADDQARFDELWDYCESHPAPDVTLEGEGPNRKITVRAVARGNL